MKRFVGFVFSSILLLCFGFLSPLSAQQTNGRLAIPLVALTYDGRLVTGLQSVNLRITGVKATIQNVTSDMSARKIVLLLDISGSMGGEDEEIRNGRWNNAKELVNVFLHDVSPQDFVALDVFATKEREIVPFTHDFASIRRAIGLLPEPDSTEARSIYGRETHSGDALSAILEAPDRTWGFGDSIVFFSDGEFPEYPVMKTVRRRLAKRDIRVFLVFAVADTPAEMFLHPYQGDAFQPIVDGAEAFMASTGGASFRPRVPGADPWEKFGTVYWANSAEKRVGDAYSVIQATYRVELQLKQPLRRGRKLKLELTDAKGKRVRNAALFYPRLLEPQTGNAH